MKFVLLLSNVRSEDANTVKDHQAALVECDDAFVYVLNPVKDHVPLINLAQFDAVIIHYSLVCFMEYYINAAYRSAIRDFRGLKAIFIQDEYRSIYPAIDAMISLGIDVLFTCVPPTSIEAVYGQLRRKGVRIEPTLTGYVPDNLIALPKTPIKDRPLDVIYRGRLVPYCLGQLGREKVNICKMFQKIASQYNLNVDLDWREEARIYGNDWPKFLSSGRTSLGTESGASICDFTGELAAAVTAYLKLNPEAEFEDAYDALLHPYEGNVLINTISPRAFESIALGTALVQFPGPYSDVLVAGDHYVPLAKDLSNVAEVIEAIRDIDSLERMARRTYDDIIRSDRYSYRRFARVVFAVMREEWERRIYRHVSVPSLLAELASPKPVAHQSTESWRTAVEAEIRASEAEIRASEAEIRASEAERARAARLRDFALANEGAIISASSPFFPRPHDADYLLRAPAQGGYAAAISGEERYFVEIDLGKVVRISRIEIDWFDSDNFPAQILIERSVSTSEWEDLFEIRDNDESSQCLVLDPPAVLHTLRITASRFHGDPRMLIRGLRVLGAPEEVKRYAPGTAETSVLDAALGATLLGASPFFPAPHDAAQLLRSWGGYAAASEAGLPQWIEFNLGRHYEIAAVEIAWFSARELPLDFEVSVKSDLDGPWTSYASVRDNWQEITVFEKPTVARFLRLSATRFARDARMLVRGIGVWAVEVCEAVPPKAGTLGELRPAARAAAPISALRALAVNWTAKALPRSLKRQWK